MRKLMNLVRIGLAGAALGFLGAGAPALAQSTEQIEQQLARDLTVAQKPIYQVPGHLGANRIDVDAWVDNPGLTYAVGQPLHLMVRPKHDAYITVVDVGSSGRVAILYPNHYQRDARVRAGSTVMIPSHGASWEINVGGPAGVDLIQVIASRRPLTLPELTQLVRSSEGSPFVTLGRSGEEVARDLVAQLTQPGTGTEANAGVRNVLVRVVDRAAGILPAPTVSTLLPPQPAAVYGLSIRSDKPVYRVGETVRIIASAQHDCRLTLINVGAGGHAVQLFPNTYQRDNLLRAGEVAMIPSPQSPVQFVAHGPAGVEGVVAICRDEAMPALYPNSMQAGSGGDAYPVVGTTNSIGHDLVVTLTTAGDAPAKAEQASASYLIVQ